MKKIFGLIAVFAVGFISVLTVNAISGTASLGYNASYRIEKADTGPSFKTSILASSLSKPSICVQAQAGRKMFNTIWYDSGKGTDCINQTVKGVDRFWSANGTWDTRATWTNTTSGSTIEGRFYLNNA